MQGHLRSTMIEKAKAWDLNGVEIIDYLLKCCILYSYKAKENSSCCLHIIIWLINKYYSYFPRMLFNQASQANLLTLKKDLQKEAGKRLTFVNILASFHELGESGIPKFSNRDVILVLLILCTICGSTQSLF